MPSLNYDDIYSYFLGNVNDYHIASLNVQDTYELMLEWLHKAAARPYFRRLFKSFVLDDDNGLVTYTFNIATDESQDADFLYYVLAKGMVVEWLEPQVKKTSLIAQNFSGKEQKFYSQQQHLTALQGLLAEAKNEQRKMIRDRGYIYNSYLEE